MGGLRQVKLPPPPPPRRGSTTAPVVKAAPVPVKPVAPQVMSAPPVQQQPAMSTPPVQQQPAMAPPKPLAPQAMSAPPVQQSPVMSPSRPMAPQMMSAPPPMMPMGPRFKKGGAINLKDCKVSTCMPAKKNANW